MTTEVGIAVVGADADNGNRFLELVASSVPARNRLIPSSWLTVNNSVVSTVNENLKTVAFAKVGSLRGLVRHAPVQVSGVGATGISEAKKPGTLLIVAL
jgi:hypothetical protein